MCSIVPLIDCLGLSLQRLDSEVLLLNVIGKEREYVYSHPETPLNKSELSDFNSLIMKRNNGYPVAYPDWT